MNLFICCLKYFFYLLNWGYLKFNKLFQIEKKNFLDTIEILLCISYIKQQKVYVYELCVCV